ncbi:DoxX family protein [Haloprofundus halobius]|uniref:DoxX family protein n=1 Tax=Haloprofundus halobius TaxID=2876194 RepID=UPI003CCCA3D6
MQTQSERLSEEAQTDVGGHSVLFKLARLAFGAAIGYAAATNFQDMEGSVAYAEAKGVPNAETLVPFGSGMAVVGSLGVVLWRLPILASGAVLAYLVGVTRYMHDFWNVDDDAESQNELYHFLKNVGLVGAALAFLVRAARDRAAKKRLASE